MSTRSRAPDYTRGGYLFLLPNFGGFTLFVFLPVIASLVLSFALGTVDYVDILTGHLDRRLAHRSSTLVGQGRTPSRFNPILGIEHRLAGF